MSDRCCRKSEKREKKSTPKVAIANDCIQDFYPMTNPPYPPVSTASSVSTNGPKPLDEIGLLKKGRLNKNYERKMCLEEQPVTMAELARRGFLKEDGRIVHSIPPTSASSGSAVSTTTASNRSRASSSRSRGISTVLSKISLLGEKLIAEDVYDVGLPHENAKLKIGKTMHGKRYELVVGQEFQAVLDLSEKAKTLITFNS